MRIVGSQTVRLAVLFSNESHLVASFGEGSPAAMPTPVPVEYCHICVDSPWSFGFVDAFFTGPSFPFPQLWNHVINGLFGEGTDGYRYLTSGASPC